jgi:putative endonuclease
MAVHNEFGRAAEARAAAHLAGRGWRVLDRNWRWRRRELDLVARRGDVVAFIEVRARRGTLYGHPLETVGWRKRRDIEAAAAAWAARHGGPRDVYRFDVITLVDPGAAAGLSAGAVLEHVADAWRPHC